MMHEGKVLNKIREGSSLCRHSDVSFNIAERIRRRRVVEATCRDCNAAWESEPEAMGAR